MLTRSYNPIWNLRDLTGLPLDDTYFVFFLENDIPYAPQNVYSDPSGTILSNPVQVSAAGTIGPALYFDPTLVYRIEIRQGNTQNDALIWLIEDYIPSGGQEINPGITVTPDNMITNPQFVSMNTSNNTVFNTAGTYNIAAGWFLDLVGVGSTTISQIPLVSGDNCPTNAPYALRVASSGWTTATLRQRFNQNGTYLSGNDINFQMTVRSLSGGLPLISSALYYSPNTSVQLILSSTAITTGFGVLSQSSPLNAWNNSSIPPNAFVEVRVALPISTIDITSIQLSPGFSQDYDQTSVERQLDQTFNYFQPQLNFKPIPSLLTGWDFPLNPAQFGTVAVPNPSISTTPSYIWDQTICACSSGTMTVSTSSVGAFFVTSSATNQAFYMLQYLTGYRALEIALSNLSVNINANYVNGTAPVASVYLFYGNMSSTIPKLSTTIGTINSAGVFTLTAANWAEILQPNGDSSSGAIGSSRPNNLGFKGWNGAQASGSIKNFAIVVTFTVPVSGTNIGVNSISLVPGDIPTRPAPQSQDAVLRECQYYYEKSYDPSTVIGTATYANAMMYAQSSSAPGSTTTNFQQEAFGFNFKSAKIAPTPLITFYSVTTASTPNVVTAFITGVTTASVVVNNSANATITGTNYWSGRGVGSQGVAYYATPGGLTTVPVTGTGVAIFAQTAAFLQFHYVVDARLGVV